MIMYLLEMDAAEAGTGLDVSGLEVFEPFASPAAAGYNVGFAGSLRSVPGAALESLYNQLDLVESLFENGSYMELDNGYLIQADSLLPEAPKLLIYEDEQGLHLQGRGNGMSEDKWLDVTFTGSHYLSRNKAYRVSEGRAMDQRTLAIYQGEEDRLHITVASMCMPPKDLTFEKL